MDEIFLGTLLQKCPISILFLQKNQKRVRQLGENPEDIFIVGSLGVENIKKMNFKSRSELAKKLKISFEKRNIMFSYHPERKE